MRTQREKPGGVIRAVIIALLALVFMSLVIFSVVRIRYSTDAGVKNELAITELTLTDKVKRDENGGLTVAKEAEDGTDDKAPGADRACPT